MAIAFITFTATAFQDRFAHIWLRKVLELTFYFSDY